ncbi:ATP-dependent dethiobiotin synthetase BioD [Rhodococcus sp. BP-252]|uniref:dethiobiotin synthase n=1 Tax=unclassified Rhodococcus (in: high G+C Gram-positive bacteria) TaxID=192944 RepID=UPI001C9A79E6|nr:MULTISPECIES: dethiobiotin synthase [unclassified Rhodococcus (in: high G+C Gram-positive bacteria)]MBY6413621.1 ATP-dependent dethiobiotin synthetase BioD [Rhodococcus sp. BP-320]MBY6418392.1 ATP-dependent dethiobiotin synthetase BioD [Rhodococcus sp. BP-321]MBY6422517.1 ATP-dependent dethiobiotin synthetase BioD [Rhodococcus sp. BP-324]MBY6428337.1 ATP-dependent dethiobiotin synthetase BioD [Rhodococcus sp. BP-323]MBY6433514.1 ATP-dependent dethiobiotin synthetase BioD [Rhodococcus sp. BP
MTALIVTGTSTDVGKTVVTAALAATAQASGKSVAVCKPAQTGVLPGEPGDLAEIERLTGVDRLHEFARYPDPLAPNVAARRAGLPELALDDVAAGIDAIDSDLVLVEGAGGLLVRFGDFTLLDVARRLNVPVVVVCSAGLGTLNHSQLTTDALAAAGVHCAGLIIGSWPADPDLAAVTNLAELPDVTGVPLIGRVPAGAGSRTRESFVADAPGWLRPVRANV